jgi:nucleoside-diphosphate-sugar epimerase
MKKIKNILVTGGAGFIGSHTVDLLVSKKYNVTVLDNFSFGKKIWVNKKAKIIKGDIKNLKTCINSCNQIDAVFHFAAMSRAGPSQEAITKCINENVLGTKNILEASRIRKIKKFVYAGSSTYYGNIRGFQKENFNNNCLNPYALSKYLGEELCLYYYKNYNLSLNIMRYFNVYGERQPTRGNYALVIGIFLDRLKNKKPLIIHGNGNQRRDFVNVKDVAEANFLSMQSKVKGEIFNVGTGKNFSIKQVAKIISPYIDYTKPRKGDAKETLADIAKIRKMLKWKPKIGILEGLSELLAN